MLIGNRNFPYPILNRNEILSDYNDTSIFKLNFDVEPNGIPIIQNGNIIFKNLHYTLTDEYLISLLESQKIKGAFIIECSASIYRKSFDISPNPYDLYIPATNIHGNIIVSCYLYALENIPNFKSDSFISEYSKYSFDIDKFDIIAVDDGFKIKIDLDPKQDNKVSSIFQVIKKEDNGKLISYANKEKNIVIYLPTLYYDAYEKIKTKKEYNNISFSILAIPVLASCFEEIYNKYEDIEEILDNHQWFNAVRIGYKREIGKELSYEDFATINNLELAQIVLNNASCNALEDFSNLLLGNMEEGNEDE